MNPRMGDIGPLGGVMKDQKEWGVELTGRERFLLRVGTVTAEGCWEWRGPFGRGGYGMASAAGLHRASHRVSFEMFVGPIPDGLQIDHLCRNRKCVNPHHLEPVTAQENQRRAVRTLDNRNFRQTHCKNGHPLSGLNLYQYGTERRCRECGRAAHRRWHSKKKEARMGDIGETPGRRHIEFEPMPTTVPIHEPSPDLVPAEPEKVPA